MRGWKEGDGVGQGRVAWLHLVDRAPLHGTQLQLYVSSLKLSH